MENALTKAPTTKPSLVSAMASRYSIDPGKFLTTLKATLLSNASDEELQAFCIVAHEYGLNPFLKEIHAFPNKSGGITAVVGIDGWCSLMNRRSDFDGIEFSFEDDNGKPVSCTAKIHIKGRAHPVTVTEYYSECVRQTDPWRTCPRRMLRHKALIQCARVAFGFSGIHDEDDALAMAVNVTPAEEKVEKVKFKRFSAHTEALPEPAPAELIPDPNAELVLTLLEAGYTLDHLNRYLIHEQETASEFASFDDIPAELRTKLTKAKAAVVRGIKAMEGGAK